MNSFSIEHISQFGEINFIDTMPASGLLQIGADEICDVKIANTDAQGVFAIIDLVQSPPTITCLAQDASVLLNSAPLAYQEMRAIDVNDQLQVDNDLFIVVQHAPAYSAALNSVATGDATENADLEIAAQDSPSLASDADYEDVAQSDKTSKVIVLRMPKRTFDTEVENETVMEFTITNGGMLVGTFVTIVQGLTEDWVSVDKPEVNLFEGQTATIRVSVTPSRSPDSTAGEDFFSIKVISPDYPHEQALLGGTLNIAPFREFSIGDLTPRDQMIPYRKKHGRVKFDLVNRGNVPTDFLVNAGDGSNAIQFMFHTEEMDYAGQTEIRLDPGEHREMEVHLDPKVRKFFAMRRTRYNFNVGASILNGFEPPSERMGQAGSRPLIGPLVMFLLLGLLFFTVAFSFRPRIREFDAVVEGFTAEDAPIETQAGLGALNDNAQANVTLASFAAEQPTRPLNSSDVKKQNIAAGEELEITWDASVFTTVKIEPDLGTMEERSGSITVAPLDNTTYVIEASNIFSQLFPSFFGQVKEVQVDVEAVFPVVRFKTDLEDILVGETVELDWSVSNADEVFLVINGAAETVPSEQHRSRRPMTLQEDATISVKALNRYTDAAGVSKTVQINVSVPTPTPLPPPVLVSFNVEPQEVTLGDTVRISWNVEGVESVNIEPLGEYPPQGSLEDVPQSALAYILSATNGQEDLRELREVSVNLPPTPTPVPGAPQIELFTISPDEVEKGSTASQNVELAWSVIPNEQDDDVTVTINGGAISRTDLPLQGNIKITGEQDAEFTLTASNEGLDSSQAVNLKVSIPAPVVTLLDPSVSTAVGGTGVNVKVSGNNFVEGAKAQVNGQDRPTSFQSGTEVTVTLLAADLQQATDLQIGVVNPESAGGQTSNTSPFKLEHPAPTISAITPNLTTLPAGAVDTIVSVVGAGFIEGTVLQVNGTAVETNVGNATQLSATIPGSMLEAAGTLAVSVMNAAPGGGTSTTVPFTVNNPAPKILSFSLTGASVGSPANGATAGDGPLEITILGEVNPTNRTGFMPDSVVRFNGVDSIATYVSSSVLKLQVTPEQVKYLPSGSAITIFNPPPGGGTTGAPTTLTVQKQNSTTTIVTNGTPYNGVTPVVGEPFSITANIQGVNNNIWPEGHVSFNYDVIGLAPNNDVAISPTTTNGQSSTVVEFASGVNSHELNVGAQFTPGDSDPNVQTDTEFFSSSQAGHKITLQPAWTKTDLLISTRGSNSQTLSPGGGPYEVDAYTEDPQIKVSMEAFVDSALQTSIASLITSPGIPIAVDEGSIRIFRQTESGSVQVSGGSRNTSVWQTMTPDNTGSATYSSTSWSGWYNGPQKVWAEYVPLTTNPKFNAHTLVESEEFTLWDSPYITLTGINDDGSYHIIEFDMWSSTATRITSISGVYLSIYSYAGSFGSYINCSVAAVVATNKTSMRCELSNIQDLGSGYMATDSAFDGASYRISVPANTSSYFRQADYYGYGWP